MATTETPNQTAAQGTMEQVTPLESMEQPVPNTSPIPEHSDNLREVLQVRAPSEVVEWLNVLLYADPGIGKTYQIGTCANDPRLAPVLLFDAEGGTTTLRHMDNIDVIPIRSIVELEEKYNKLYASIKVDDDGTPRMYYKTVAIDTVTELADLDMRFIMKAAYARNPDKVDIDVPSPREWGINRSHVRKIIRAFRDLPCHTIFTAHVGTEHEENMPPKFFPGFAGKLKQEVPGFCDIVGYMSNDTTTGVLERRVQFQGTRRVVAKDRTSALGDLIIDPSMTKFWDLIQAHDNNINNPTQNQTTE